MAEARSFLAGDAGRNPSQAAARLGMTLVSRARWLDRRPWLLAALRELGAYRFHADD